MSMSNLEDFHSDPLHHEFICCLSLYVCSFLKKWIAVGKRKVCLGSAESVQLVRFLGYPSGYLIAFGSFPVAKEIGTVGYAQFFHISSLLKTEGALR